ncbi:MAG: tail fiber domain-containing protein [Xanthomonadales bacterium]|jgi:hypothetical protein|nr:tail fiber domain-containing protein [Xanthomonadales bacterium]
MNLLKPLIAISAVALSTTAFSQALYVAPSGDVGVGTDLPISSFEVTRADGSSQILVNEMSETSAPRTLFQLRNKGNTKFGVLNTDLNVEWSFANPGTDFRLSRQGSGAVEMRVLNNGDLVIAGVLTENSDVNAKTAITPVDPETILEKVAALPINQWEYKDARGEPHIGPMAQDFHAAFGLGKSETGISTLDTSGVALAAIQALVAQNRQLTEELEALKQQQAATQAALTQLLDDQGAAEPVLTSTRTH